MLNEGNGSCGVLKLSCYLLQILWLRVGRRFFRRLYEPTGSLTPYEEFSDHSGDMFATAKRDFSTFSRFVDLSGKRILDICSGEGKKTAFYSLKSKETVGVDIGKDFVREAHRFARNRDLQQVDFVTGDAGHLPFRASSFDLVISNDAFEHLKDWRNTLREIERILKDRGLACLSFGPLWLSPFGSHMDFGEFFSPPWSHLLFSEEDIKGVFFALGKIKDTDLNKPLFMHHLNHITSQEFKQSIRSNEFSVRFFKLFTVPPFNPFLKTPFREFFTTRVAVVLQKASHMLDMAAGENRT
jgi:ubiquinone/menaquinone biosynthesis C-methylase UbiE